VALEIHPTSAVTVKWNPVSVVAARIHNTSSPKTNSQTTPPDPRRIPPASGRRIRVPDPRGGEGRRGREERRGEEGGLPKAKA
jgi:hypothetical protein